MIFIYKGLSLYYITMQITSLGIGTGPAALLLEGGGLSLLSHCTLNKLEV